MLKSNIETFEMFISNLSEKALDLICILKTYACFPLNIFRVKRATYRKKYAKCIYNIVFFKLHLHCHLNKRSYVFRVKLILAIPTGGNISFPVMEKTYRNFGLAL